FARMTAMLALGRMYAHASEPRGACSPDEYLALTARGLGARYVDAAQLREAREYLGRGFADSDDLLYSAQHVGRQELGMHGHEQDVDELLGEERVRRLPRGGHQMVRLVEYEPVRPAVAHPHVQQLGQEFDELLGTLRDRDAGHADDAAREEVLEHLHGFLERRLDVRSADDDRAFQLLVVAFGVHEAELVVALAQRVDDTLGDARFAARGRAADQRAAGVRLEVEGIAVGVDAERDRPPRQRLARQRELVLEQRVDEVDDA